MAQVRVCDLRGIRAVRYTKKDTGEVREGYEFHFSYSDDSVDGSACGSCYCDKSGVKNLPKIGDKIHIYHDNFNRRFTYIPM